MKKIIYMWVVLILFSCNSDWLDIRPDDALVVPREVEDYQALLDNTSVMNISHVGGLGELAAGDFKVSDDVFLSSSALVRNSYSWSLTDDFFEGNRDPDWRAAWQRILNANLVLEGINNVGRTNLNAAAWDNVKGAAYFYRAYDFYALAQQYCSVYDLENLDGLGLPLRLSSNLNIVVKRATLRETYNQIIADLLLSLDLLPPQAQVVTRPSNVAASALLSRVYLLMGDYEKALHYANSVLDRYPTLLTYNTISPSKSYPFSALNSEVIFHARLSSYSMFTAARLQVESDLLDLYEQGDLRRQLFFGTNNTTNFFRGSYDGSSFFFAGLATDEIYLIQAECKARLDDLDGATQALNTLLKMRWALDVPFPDFRSDNKNIVLAKIYQERRKELCFRGMRWADVRRFNKESAFQTILHREIQGEKIFLEPNDLRYIFPLDENEITIGGLQQNPRK